VKVKCRHDTVATKKIILTAEGRRPETQRKATAEEHEYAVIQSDKALYDDTYDT
jgi:hypothetical protein